MPKGNPWTRANPALITSMTSGYPTLAQLNVGSSTAGHSSIPSLETTLGYTNTSPSQGIHSGGAMAAVATANATINPTLSDLRKAKTTLPTLNISTHLHSHE
eukprot:3984384-Amphidinium_carterae.2